MDEQTLTSQPAADQAVRWAERAIGSRMSVTHRFDATSSTVLGLADGEARRFVLRLFTNADWLRREPHLARHEASALETAAEIPLPTPELLAYDADGAQAGVPAILMTRLAGAVVIPQRPGSAWLNSLGDVAFQTARADVASLPWQYDPWIATEPDLPHEHRSTWEAAAGVVAGGLPSSRAVVLHRDLHPMNVLFAGGRLTGVVDWVNACVGPAPADVAHCRVNLVAMYGLAAADVVRDRWCALTGDVYNPTWDLVAMLGTLPVAPYPPWSRMGLQVTGRDMERRLAGMLRRALAELGQ